MPAAGQVIFEPPDSKSEFPAVEEGVVQRGKLDKCRFDYCLQIAWKILSIPPVFIFD